MKSPPPEEQAPPEPEITKQIKKKQKRKPDEAAEDDDFLEPESEKLSEFKDLADTSMQAEQHEKNEIIQIAETAHKEEEGT